MKIKPTVLLVEDSPDDVEFARRALDYCQVPHTLMVAEQGDQAWELLTGCDSATGQPIRPALILLDLNIPGLQGRELLRKIRADARLSMVPVVVVSTSIYRSDVEECYRLGCNCYHQKPHDLRRYDELIQQIAAYWLSAAISPRAPREHSTADRAHSPQGEPTRWTVSRSIGNAADSELASHALAEQEA